MWEPVFFWQGSFLTACLWIISCCLNVAVTGSQAHNQEKFLRPPLKLIGNFRDMFRKSALPYTAWDRF